MASYWTLLRRQWPLLLFGFLCVFWGNFGQSFFIGWYSDAIKKSLGLSAQQYGMTYSLATLASALSLMWMGGWIDRWPLKRFVLMVSGGLFVACLLLSFATNIWLLALAFYGVRLFGQGLFPHAGITTMARHFEADRGKAISIATSGVSLGEVALPIAAVFLVHSIGWQQSWWVIALAIPLLFLPLSRYVLKKADWQDAHLAFRTAANGESANGRNLLLKDPRFWLAAPTLLATPFALTAIFIHQDFILAQKRWSFEWMATCFIIYGVVHWLSSVGSGLLVDRFGAIALLRVFILPLIAALLLVANVDGMWVALAFMALLGVGIGSTGPVAGALWAEVYGPAVIGGVRSAAGAVMVFSTSISPVAVGWLIDHGYSLGVIFNGLALTYCVGLSLLAFSYGRASRYQDSRL